MGIKNALKRADQLMDIFGKKQMFELCGEIKGIKNRIEGNVGKYLREGGEDVLGRIEEDVAIIKSKQY